MIRILIADDHPIIRLGLKTLIKGEGGMAVVGEAEGADELLGLAATRECDVIVMDISMPGRGGLDVLQDLRKAKPELPVLILSVHPEDQCGVRALRAGAAGYVTKSSAASELVGAIRSVASGRKYVSPALAEILATRLGDQDDVAVHEKLSNREYLVLCMLASGKTIGEIAQGFSLSVKTVSTYRHRALQKMGVRTDAQLIAYAVRHRLCEE